MKQNLFKVSFQCGKVIEVHGEDAYGIQQSCRRSHSNYGNPVTIQQIL